MKKLHWLCLIALLFLVACTASDKQQRLAQLAELEQRNTDDSLMTDDSLAEQLADYFDRHGTPNEQLRAHYILGRTYADLGEAPAAIQAYLDAATRADTTAQDCDWAKLCRVYGQMSDVFYRQNLMEDNLFCLDNTITYAWKAKDTIQALTCQMHKVNTLLRLQKKDEALHLFAITFRRIANDINLNYASKFGTLPVEVMLNQNDIVEAGEYLQLYEEKSGFFDDNGNIAPGRETYYYFRGHYHMLKCQYDSAEFFFRKEMQDGMDFYNQNAGARGLALLYKQTHQPDSSAKYALLSYQMLDSLYQQTSTWDVAQTKALYDYSRHQQLAQQEREMAEQEQKKNNAFRLLIVAITAALIFVLLLWRWNRKRKDRLYRQKMDELEKAHADLESLHIQAENLKAMRKLQDEEIENGKAEISGLRSVEERLLRLIKEKEITIVSLQQELCRGENNAAPDSSFEYQLEQTSAYLLLRNHSRCINVIKEEEWAEVEKSLESILPDFFQFLGERRDLLGKNGFRICVLLRLHFRVKDVANLMNVTSAYVSARSSEVLSMLFHMSGGGRALAEKLSLLH